MRGNVGSSKRDLIMKLNWLCWQECRFQKVLAWSVVFNKKETRIGQALSVCNQKHKQPQV